MTLGLSVKDISGSPESKKQRVLFVCTGNTCRSVMAEYLARKTFGLQLDVASAGIHPGSRKDTENAIFTLKNFFNVDAGDHTPQDVRLVDLAGFDLVVAMNNDVANRLREIDPHLGDERLIRWKIMDPFGHDLSEYKRCADAIFAQLKILAILRDTDKNTR